MLPRHIGDVFPLDASHLLQVHGSIGTQQTVEHSHPRKPLAPTPCLWLCLFLIHGRTTWELRRLLPNIRGLSGLQWVFRCPFISVNSNPTPTLTLIFFSSLCLGILWNTEQLQTWCSMWSSSVASWSSWWGLPDFFSFSARISFHTWASSSGSQQQLSRLWGWAL